MDLGAKYNHNHGEHGLFSSGSDSGSGSHDPDAHRPRVGDTISLRTPAGKYASGHIESVSDDGRSAVVNFRPGGAVGEYHGRREIDLTRGDVEYMRERADHRGHDTGRYFEDLDAKGAAPVDVVTKATGTVTPVEDSKSKHGEFDVILSTSALDRDGDELYADEWKTPLPDKITFDSDHGMSVASCVGSGKPFINDNGQLQVRGTFASTPHGQAVRTLVKEGHIDSVSVAFRNLPKTSKDAKPQRELLNGAFVAVPANPEAKVLEAKAAKDDDDHNTKEPYGDVDYADPGFRNGVKRYPINDAEHVREDAIKRAGAKFGIKFADDKKSANEVDVLGGWKPDSMNTVADMFQNDPLDGPQLEAHIRGIHEAATRIREIAVRLGNGMPYSDPDATPGVLEPNNRSFDGAETKAAACNCPCQGCTEKSSPQKSASTEAPASAAVPAGTDDDVELLKAKAWADAFLLEPLDGE